MSDNETAERQKIMHVRECECEIRKGEKEKEPLEAFTVMDGVCGVLCHNCGALSYHGPTEEQAVTLWNNNELQRPVGCLSDDPQFRLLLSLFA